MAPLRFKVKFNNVTFNLPDLPEKTTFEELKQKIFEATEVRKAQQSVLCGFPPKQLNGEENASLADLGLQSGTVLTLCEISPEALPEQGPTIFQSEDDLSPARLADLKQQFSTIVKETSKSSEKENSPRSSVYLSLKEMGFSSTQAARAFSLSGGDLEAAVELAMGQGFDLDSKEPLSHLQPNVHSQFVRRNIDADNSCLFNAIGYVFERNRRAASRLRNVISNVVIGDPERWTEAVLGRHPVEYCRWIKNPSHWGGEIELAILSNFYSSEIVVVDIQTLHCYRYGSDFSQRVFLLYDGVHYDALAEVLSNHSKSDNPEETDITIFESIDKSKMDCAISVAADLKEQRQFVDLAGCDLKCLICGQALKGEKGALEHAKSTGHQNFGQI